MPASGKSPKKTESKAKPAAVKKTTTKSAASKTKSSAAAKKSPTKSKKGAAVGGMGGAPMVDTSFAAEAAARMLSARVKLGNAPPRSEGAAQRESGAFKQMKENLNKPAAGGISSAMGNTFGPNKTNLPNPDKGHVVRDQTTSSVNRINVPRRTGG
ncbi:MAG TPA: hypothetical protein VGP94_04590 [Tepidisphaeraceae bacterium]|nr:hypothetical protein [Tepidisphaeraceae bacterium]